MFDAVLFDMDGTLVDSEVLWRDGFMMLAEEMSLTVDDALYAGFVGATVAQVRGALVGWLPAGQDVDVFIARWEATVRQREEQSVPLKPGALELLDAVAGRMPLAVVTSSGRAHAEHLLAEVGILSRFDLLIAADDVERTKPDPEPYLQAARQLGVEIARCLVFEDSDTGARAGVASGAQVVQVPDLVPVSEEVRGLGHVIAEDVLSGARVVGLIG